MKPKATCKSRKAGKAPRKGQATFTRSDEEWRLITEAAVKVGLTPASYVRTVAVRAARADLAA